MSIMELESLSREFGATLLGIVLRSSMLLAVCAFLIVFFRSRPAEFRHFIWRGVLYGLLLLPILPLIAPPFRPHSKVLTRAQRAIFPTQLNSSAGKAQARVAALPAKPVDASAPAPWILIAAAIYAASTAVLLLRLGFGLFRLNRIWQRSQPIIDSHLRELGHDVWLQSLCPMKPEIRVSAEVCVPMAIGAHEPSILLPSGWRLWRPVKLRAALIHEMAHARRRDPSTAFLGSLAVCLFWIHPLAYWLRRQLAALSEEACDEATLQYVEPGQYAEILIEFAGEVTGQGGRLIAVSTIAAQKSLLNRRLERVFSVSQSSTTGYRLVRHQMVRWCLVSAFLPALYLTANARFDQARVADSRDQVQTISIGSQDKADELETDLMRDPENLRSRAAVMAYYANQGKTVEFTRHLLWVIAHHPDAAIAAMKIYGRPSDSQSGTTSGNDERVGPAWEQALATHPDSAEVLVHAGLYFQREDAHRALALFSRAGNMTATKSTDRDLCVQASALVYTAAVITELKNGDARFRVNSIAMPLNVAGELRTGLDTSTDPALLSAVGMNLVRFDNQQLGLTFIHKAIDLDPAEPRWKDALESAEAEPIRRSNMQALKASGQTAHPVRIGAGVANANLLKKVEPEYPPMAQQAGIEGDVELRIDIGWDGHVQALQLVRGHPLLVKAASDAVLQWVYRPTLLNGQAVVVTTSVVVPFTIAR